MNERLNISDLSALLTEYSGRDKKDTELFLRELIAVVSDGLLEEKLVKVKGLGTFKVVPVEERESVHVNTGERFVIPAHAKFTFTPDRDLRELVNKPFAAFETTELNEGVSFPEPAEEVTEDDEREEESEVDIEEKKEADVSQISEPTVETEIDIESELKAEPEPELEQESELKSESSPGFESESLPEQKEEVTPSVEPEEIKDALQEEITEVPLQAIQKEVVRSAKKKPGNKNNSRFLLTLLLLVLIIGGFFIFNMSWKGHNKQPLDTVQQEPDKVETTKTVQPEADFDSEENVEKPPVEQVAPKEIVTEKIVPDTRLTLISLKHYGHKVFWVYIYEHNKSIIDNPNNISIGTELIIPDPSLYGIDANNPESVAKAKAKQAEINSKF